MKQLLLSIGIATLLGGCKTSTPEVDPNVIAQKYCDSIKNQDYETYRSLFFPKGESFFTDERKESWLRRTDIHDLEIVSASIPYIDVKFKRSPNGRESTETVYVMDNGKIKCDPFGILHSALTLISCYMSLDNDDITQHQFWIEQLGKAGAPVDGYNTNDPESNEETLLRIKEWLIENLAKLDSTKLNTQQIPLSEADLKTVEAWLRVEIKRRA